MPIKKTKKTNPMLISLIQDLKKLSAEKNVPLWRDIAARLEKAKRNWPAVNLSRIDRYIQNHETALVPGKVLSAGELTKKVSIAAWDFSEKSQEKIKKAGGKVLTIEELMKQNPEGKDIRIVG
ncbi:MAG: 50S ribosomal protein L18e [Candidatus Thermoplasmatota archaeon]